MHTVHIMLKLHTHTNCTKCTAHINLTHTHTHHQHHNNNTIATTTIVIAGGTKTRCLKKRVLNDLHVFHQLLLTGTKFLALWHSSKMRQPSNCGPPHQSISCCSRVLRALLNFPGNRHTQSTLKHTLKYELDGQAT